MSDSSGQPEAIEALNRFIGRLDAPRGLQESVEERSRTTRMLKFVDREALVNQFLIRHPSYVEFRRVLIDEIKQDKIGLDAQLWDDECESQLDR